METKCLQLDFATDCQISGPDVASIQFTLLSILDVLNDCGLLMVKYYSCSVFWKK